jgi:hypothetical protein
MPVMSWTIPVRALPQTRSGACKTHWARRLTVVLEKIWLIVDGIFMWVSTLECDPGHSRFQLAAGSSSLVLTTSGVSSEDIVPTGGRYGYVTIGPHSKGFWSNLSLRKVYSITRLATLLAVILNLIFFNVTAPLDCQVSAVFRICDPNSH